ncbi:MAG: ribose 5-phosphate isomerase B [Gracilibacteraceae bacterium]|nr:ribose 5-phosphate isomerase B [Gracilibacteraceae bacterium]
MTVALGADHGGYALKEEVKRYLLARSYQVVDCGVDSAEPADYPFYGKKVAESVAAGRAQKGVAICGTGIGMAVAANKVPGIRAALCTDSFMAKMARAHNDAQVLAMGARVVGTGLALDILEVFLRTDFEGGRHERRVRQLDQPPATDNNEG